MAIETITNVDEVGITRPTTGVDHVPSCRGYTKRTTREESKFLRELGLDGSFNKDDATIISSSTTVDGWRVLRYHKRVGFGKRCYRRVRHAMLDWDFEAREGNKYMGILSAETPKKAVSIGMNEADPSFIARRHMLATFTRLNFPKPLKSLFVVNPVHVVYEVKDDSRLVPTCLFSSTAYATLTGHILAGEERVTVLIDAGDAVAVEILSFSRPAPSIIGKCIWPLIGRMQQQFFLSEINHLDKIAKNKT
jgi:uncharacterized protein (UPF0548 family)